MLLQKMFSRQQSVRSFSSRALRDKMEEKIVARQAQVKEFNKEHKNTKLGDVTVG